MHALEKIMARASGNTELHAGQIVEVNVDSAMLHDRAGPKVMELMKKHGLEREPFAIPEKMAIYFDHDAPSCKLNSATKQKAWRDFAMSKGCTHINEAGCGVSHILMMEQGWITPGRVIVGTDSHACTGGALGALAAGIGETEMTAVVMTGHLWFKVPKIAKIILNGRPSPLAGPKDIALWLLKQLGTGSFIYTAVEFAGTYVDSLSIEERSVISSMSVELGTKFGYMQPDEKTFVYLRSRGVTWDAPIPMTDSDYEYSQTVEFDVTDLPPLVAQPHGYDNIIPARDLKEGVKIDQAVIGSCTGGLLRDLEMAAAILKGKKTAPHVRLIVTPASREIYLTALNKGYIQTIVEAGGIFCPPRCGPCGSSHDGLLGPGEVCIVNANRNFRGRLGSPDALLYLASTATVAASAVEGVVCAPKEEEMK